MAARYLVCRMSWKKRLTGQYTLRTLQASGLSLGPTPPTHPGLGAPGQVTHRDRQKLCSRSPRALTLLQGRLCLSSLSAAAAAAASAPTSLSSPSGGEQPLLTEPTVRGWARLRLLTIPRPHRGCYCPASQTRLSAGSPSPPTEGHQQWPSGTQLGQWLHQVGRDGCTWPGPRTRGYPFSGSCALLPPLPETQAEPLVTGLWGPVLGFHRDVVLSGGPGHPWLPLGSQQGRLLLSRLVLPTTPVTLLRDRVLVVVPEAVALWRDVRGW